MLSKQAILQMHNGEYESALKNIERVGTLLEETKKFYADFPEMEFLNEVDAAKEEYSEAYIFHELSKGEGFPIPEEMGVSHFSYLLGLGDVPGEFRRSALVALKEGDIDSAEKHLNNMDFIYNHLVSMEEASILLKGLRRKIDITRSVLERTRSDITAEASRRRLYESMKNLSEKIEK
jgi:translin